MYYAVSTFGSQVSSIGLATSATMDVGSWTDKGAIGVSSTAGKAYNAIDPNLIAVGSTYLLNFGSFWGDIYQVALNSAATKGGGASSYQLAYNSAGTHAEEGSFMFYYSGYYYLLWSAGICCGYDTYVTFCTLHPAMLIKSKIDKKIEPNLLQVQNTKS